MNAINYIINEIRMQIPEQILEVGMQFGDDIGIASLSSLDDKIRRKVLRQRVLMDMNLSGGIETVIPLSSVPPSLAEMNYTVYTIPSELTLNKEIVSVLNLTMLPGTGPLGVGGINPSSVTMFGYGQSNPVLNVADRIGASVAPAAVVSNPHLELVGRNTVLVYANYRMMASFGIRCLLENDADLNNIQPRNLKAVSQFAVLAVKSYLYNKLIIPLNQGYLASGQELGTFKYIVESYADAEEQYRVFLEEQLAAILFMNDTTRYNRLLQTMINPSM